MANKGTAAPIKQQASEGGRVMRQERQKESLAGKKPTPKKATY